MIAYLITMLAQETGLFEDEEIRKMLKRLAEKEDTLFKLIKENQKEEMKCECFKCRTQSKVLDLLEKAEEEISKKDETHALKFFEDFTENAKKDFLKDVTERKQRELKKVKNAVENYCIASVGVQVVKKVMEKKEG